MNSKITASPFAFLIPTSTAALKSLHYTRNRDLRDWLEDYGSCQELIPRPIGAIPRSTAVIKLERHSIIGRRWIHFGAVRGNEVVLKASTFVDDFHFKIGFDSTTGQLMIVDTSSTGVYISDDTSQSGYRLHHQSCILSGSATISFGPKDEMVFQLVPQYTRCCQEFFEWFCYYASTIDRPPPRACESFGLPLRRQHVLDASSPYQLGLVSCAEITSSQRKFSKELDRRPSSIEQRHSIHIARKTSIGLPASRKRSRVDEEEPRKRRRSEKSSYSASLAVKCGGGTGDLILWGDR